MSGCTCENPTDFRATGENNGKDKLYLRCGHCGDKAGTVAISIAELFEAVSDPEELDFARPEVAEKTAEHKAPTVSIHFNMGDSPFNFKVAE